MLIRWIEPAHGMASHFQCAINRRGRHRTSGDQLDGLMDGGTRHPSSAPAMAPPPTAQWPAPRPSSENFIFGEMEMEKSSAGSRR
jgi:hypothetical protein